jgi:TolB-like protein/Tfp pilus assembly protein PilF
LSRIIDRAIAPAPGQRYESAAALNVDLKALESRPRLAMAAIAAAAFVALAGVVWEVAARGTGATRPSAMLAGFLPASPAAVAEPRIVVLPLVNLSAEPGGEHFADGLTDELIRNLAVVEGLDVRSRTSSFAFKGRDRNLREVADRLDVNLALEATVLRAGDRIRLNASLIDIAADVPLWTGQFERELTVKNIFDIQDEIARGIVDELRLKLGAGPRRYDLNVAAYELYLSARQLVDLRGAGNARKAAELFGQVIRKDPAFAPAHAGLALAYAYLSQPANGIQFEEAHPVMRYAAIEALRLDPQLADAHCARGWVFARERDWGRAEESFRRAIALNPSLTQSYTGFTLSTLVPLGRDEEALRLLRSALRTDPLSVSLLNQLGEVQLFAGRYDEAVASLQEAWAIDPDLPFARLYLARALMFAGRVAEGIAFLEEATRSSYYLAYGYVAAGRRLDAERLLAVRPENLYSHAIIHAALGNDNEVVAAYERLATIEPHRVVLTLRFPELKRVRDDPRMVALRQRLGLP